jgi:drug/metabolite transporter (DMT)-like permease
MRQRKEHIDVLALGLLLFCCLIWGGQQVLAKATLPEVPAIFMAALRVGGATVLIWLWCRLRGIPLFGRDGTLGAGLLAGSLFALEFAGMFSGLRFTTASRLTVFLYMSPFWVAILLPLFVKSERLNRVQWLGLGIAFVALVFAMREGLGRDAPPQQLLGDLLGLGAGLAWGLTTVVIRSTKLGSVSAEKLLFYQLAVSTVGLAILSQGLGEVWAWHFSPFASLSLLLQIVVGAFLSYLLWTWMLVHYPATKISVFVFLTPVFALIFGALWLQEPVTPTLVIALALVALGIVLVNRKAPS